MATFRKGVTICLTLTCFVSLCICDCFQHQDLSSWSSADELDTSGSLSPVSGRSTPSHRRSVMFISTCTCCYMRTRCLETPKSKCPKCPSEGQIHPCHPKISPHALQIFLHLHNQRYAPSLWILNFFPAFCSSCMLSISRQFPEISSFLTFLLLPSFSWQAF